LIPDDLPPPSYPQKLGCADQFHPVRMDYWWTARTHCRLFLIRKGLLYRRLRKFMASLTRKVHYGFCHPLTM
jgi:hypothetical protein